MNNLTHVFKQFLSLSLIGFSIVMYIIFSIIGVFSDNFISNHYIAFSLFVFVPAATGIISFILRIFKKKKLNEQELEHEIVKMAHRNAGRITIPELSIDLRLPILTVQDKMRVLSENGIFEPKLTDSGAIVYQLSNYSSNLETNRAKAVI